MSNAELAQSLGSQFDFANEVKTLRLNPEAVWDDLAHFFAEFSCNVPIVSYHYVQTDEQTLIVPGLETRGDVLNMVKQGVREESIRSQMEYVGFSRFREQIIKTREPSFALWCSPPGPKEENYGDYGFLYGALIPRWQNEPRRVSMFALRIPNFDERATMNSAQLLRDLSPETQLPYVNTDTLLLNPIIFSVGPGQPIEDISDLFAKISFYLGDKFEQAKINASLGDNQVVNRLLDEVKVKFRDKIYELYTAIWSAANNIPLAIDGERLFNNILEELGMRFLVGSCPAAMGQQSSIEKILQDKDSLKDKEKHWCPVCGMLFSGNVCGCGYKLP